MERRADPTAAGLHKPAEQTLVLDFYCGLATLTDEAALALVRQVTSKDGSLSRFQHIDTNVNVPVVLLKLLPFIRTVRGGFSGAVHQQCMWQERKSRACSLQRRRKEVVQKNDLW